jgi:hypothetical protein
LGAQSEPLAIIEVLYPKKTSFRPSKWPQKFRNQKTAKNSKLPENCFEPVGIGGWHCFLSIKILFWCCGFIYCVVPLLFSAIFLFSAIIIDLVPYIMS